MLSARSVTATILLSLLACGCESPSVTNTTPNASQPPAPAVQAPAVQAPAINVPPVQVPGTAQAPATPDANVGQKAQAGVAKQGRSLDGEKGVGKMIAQPIMSLFAFKENAVFKIQIPSALKLFEASEGRKPKSHQEFMDKIITANQIRLPELRTGMEYNFHTDTGELWVHPVEPKK